MFDRICEVHRRVNVHLHVYDKEKKGRKKGNFLLLANLYRKYLSVARRSGVCKAPKNKTESEIYSVTKFLLERCVV